MSEPLSSIVAVLNTTALRWQQLAATLSEECLRQRPAPAEWSAVECLQHMIMTERLAFPVRLAALRAGQDIQGIDFDAALAQQMLARSTAELVAEFAELRAANLGLIEQVQIEEFGNGGAHNELGPVTVGELLHEWAAHDFDHTIQAERALMQPFLRGSGPWQIYFAANRIESD